MPNKTTISVGDHELTAEFRHEHEVGPGDYDRRRDPHEFALRAYSEAVRKGQIRRHIDPLHFPTLTGCTRVVLHDENGTRVGVGYSICSSSNTFSRAEGRTRAMRRAVEDASVKLGLKSVPDYEAIRELEETERAEAEDMRRRVSSARRRAADTYQRA